MHDLLNPALDAEIRKMELPDAAGRAVPVLLVEVEAQPVRSQEPGGYIRRLGSSRGARTGTAGPPVPGAKPEPHDSFDETAVPGTGPGDPDTR